MPQRYKNINNQWCLSGMMALQCPSFLLAYAEQISNLRHYDIGATLHGYFVALQTGRIWNPKSR